jgi:hypothetical protein
VAVVRRLAVIGAGMILLAGCNRLRPDEGRARTTTIVGDHRPAWQPPTRSTGCELLTRAGLVPQRRRRSGLECDPGERDG